MNIDDGGGDGGVPTGEHVTEGKDFITKIESSDTPDTRDRRDTQHDTIMTINIYHAEQNRPDISN